MCGIGGAFALTGQLPPAVLAAVAELPAALRHRGPDAAGAWVSDDGRCSLAAARLAVRDLRAAANQPFQSLLGTTVYNGELYEWPMRRDYSEDRLTSGDTEVIHRITSLQVGDLAECAGMYAAATWRAHDGSLVLVRDPVGEKPLYVVEGGRWLAFCSELRPLLAVGLLTSAFDRSTMGMYLRHGHVPEPRTMFAGARMLGPGTALEVARDGTRRVHGITAVAPRMHAEPVGPKGVHAAVVSAVRAAAVSDVPTGLFLSGGVDSSVIAAAAVAAGVPMRTLTLSAPGHSNDEFESAATTARHLHLEHDIVRADPETALKQLPRFFAAMDSPTVDGFNSFFVSKAARDSGLTVALSGVGGDELFRGYDTFAKMERIRKLARTPVRHAGRLLRPLAGPRGERLEEALNSRSDGQRYAAIRGVLSGSRAELLLGASLPWDDLQLAGEHVGGRVPSADDRGTSIRELQGYMRNQLLRDIDTFSMACGLEVRAPLLTPDLVSLAAALPNDRSLRGKRLLKDAFRNDLPAGLFERPKTGFALPWDTWLRGPLRDLASDAIQSSTARSLLDAYQLRKLESDFHHRRLHWSGLWTVVVLCDWARRISGASNPPPGRERISGAQA